MIVSCVFEFGNYTQYKEVSQFTSNTVWGKTWFRLTVMIATSLLILLPINMQRDVTKMRFTSILGLFCLFLVTLIICIQLPSYLDYYWEHTYVEGDKNTHINWYSLGSAFTSDLLFFKGTATFFFSFNCHHGLFQVYDKLEDNTKKRARKVMRRTVIVDCVLYLIVGITGYLTSPVKTPEIIIERFKLGTDTLMSIGRILIAFMLICKIPVSYNNLRVSLFELIWKTKEIDSIR